MTPAWPVVRAPYHICTSADQAVFFFAPSMSMVCLKHACMYSAHCSVRVGLDWQIPSKSYSPFHRDSAANIGQCLAAEVPISDGNQAKLGAHRTPRPSFFLFLRANTSFCVQTRVRALWYAGLGLVRKQHRNRNVIRFGQSQTSCFQ
jgi:hypothetical protein